MWFARESLGPALLLLLPQVRQLRSGLARKLRIASTQLSLRRASASLCKTMNKSAFQRDDRPTQQVDRAPPCWLPASFAHKGSTGLRADESTPEPSFPALLHSQALCPSQEGLPSDCISIQLVSKQSQSTFSRVSLLFLCSEPRAWGGSSRQPHSPSRTFCRLIPSPNRGLFLLRDDQQFPQAMIQSNLQSIRFNELRGG